jgi:hypothetical protein
MILENEENIKRKSSELGKKKPKDSKGKKFKPNMKADAEIGTIATNHKTNLNKNEKSKCSTKNEATIEEVTSIGKNGKKEKGFTFSPGGEGQVKVVLPFDQMSITNQTIDQPEHPATEIAPIHKNRAGIPAWGMNQDSIVKKSDSPKFQNVNYFS